MENLVFHIKMIEVLIEVRNLLLKIGFKIRMIISFYKYCDTKSFLHFEISWSTKKINIFLWREVFFVFLSPQFILKHFFPRYFLYFVHKSLTDLLVHSKY